MRCPLMKTRGITCGGRGLCPRMLTRSIPSLRTLRIEPGSPKHSRKDSKAWWATCFRSNIRRAPSKAGLAGPGFCAGSIFFLFRETRPLGCVCHSIQCPGLHPRIILFSNRQIPLIQLARFRLPRHCEPRIWRRNKLEEQILVPARPPKFPMLSPIQVNRPIGSSGRRYASSHGMADSTFL